MSQRIDERVESLSSDIADFVDAHTTDLTPYEDDAVRDRLNEQFRFWRR